MTREQIVKGILDQNTNASNMFRQVWKHVLAYEASSGNSLDNGLTREQYIDLFSSFCRRRAGFTARKSAVMSYVRAMVESGSLPAEQVTVLSSVHFPDLNVAGTVGQARENAVKLGYFKNFQALKTAVMETVVESGAKYPEKFDIPTAILFLAWFGLTEEEITNVRKADLTPDGITVGDRFVSMPDDVMQFLHPVKNSLGYNQQAKGVIFRSYIPSEYLIRTDRTDKMTVESMRPILYRMNKESDCRYSLSYETAFRSGVYFRAYMLECASDSFDLKDPAFAAKVLCADTSTESKHLAAIGNYNAYKKLF